MPPIEAKAEVVEIIQRSSNVKSVRLAVPEEINYKAGQFCCVHLLKEPLCKRYLSISSSPTEKGYIEFTKKITQSDFSTALGNLRVGDSLELVAPMGRFTLEDNPAKKIAFLSGGIGITPIRSICKYAADKNLDLDIVLLYANRSIKEIIFKEDFDQMQKQYPKLRVAHVLCEAALGFVCVTGLINAQVIKNEITDYAQRKFFICGPPAMVEAMKKILTDELNLAKENIVTENFQGY